MNSDNLRNESDLWELKGEQIERFSCGIFLGENLNFANNMLH